MAANAFNEMREALHVTEGNIRSLGPAGAIPFPYQEWLSVVRLALAAAESGNPLHEPLTSAKPNMGHE